MSSEEVEKEKEKISITEIISLIVLSWIVFVWGYVTRVMAMAKYWVVTGTWLPFFYILAIVALLGRRGIVISKSLIVVILYLFFLLQGKWYYTLGASQVDFIDNIAGSYAACAIAMAWPPQAKEALEGLVPSWLVPQNIEAVMRYYNGGGEPYWNAFLGPVIAWTLIFLSIAIFSTSIVFSILGPQWWDVEGIRFPGTLPTYYLVNQVYDRPMGRIFGFKTTEQKAFWVAFIVGLLLNLPYILVQLFPAIPLGGFAGGGYGHWSLGTSFPGFIQAVQAILPGAEVNCGFVAHFFCVYMILPMDITATVLLMRLIFGFIYAPLAVRTGIYPPGVWMAGSRPFPWFVWMKIGGTLGIGLYALYAARDKIKMWLSSYKTDYTIEGIPARLTLFLAIFGALLFITIWCVAGLNPVIVIAWFILITLLNIGGAKIYAIAARCVGYDCGPIFTWPLLYPIGTSLGLWQGTPPEQGNSQLALFGLFTGTMGTCISAYNDNTLFAPTEVAFHYAVAKGSNADMRKVFIYTIILFIVLTPFALAFDTWFNSHVGLVNTGEYGMGTGIFNPIGVALNTGLLSATAGKSPAITYGEYWAWTIVGAVTIWILHYLRATFPWFFIHPVGFLVGILDSYWTGWINPLIGLVVRYSLTKVLGAKRAEELIAAIFAGLAIGIGALYLLVGAVIFSTISIPNLRLLWK